MRLHSAVVCLVVVAGCADQRPEPTTPSEPNPSARNEALGAQRPVTGGNLLLSSTGKVVVADAEFDRLRVFDPAATKLELDLALPAGAWPSRPAELAERYYVLLRGLGELASVATTGGDLARLTVCAEPRGLTISGDALVVACAGGELVTVRDGQVVTTRKTGIEWRDVQVKGDAVLGTSFRSAELVRLASATATPEKVKAVPQQLNAMLLDPTLHQAQVAWRMVPTTGKTIVVHQLHADRLRLATAPTDPTGTSNPYGGGGSGPNGPGFPQGCNNSVVVTGITTVGDDGVVKTARTNDVLPVDAALSPDGTQLAVVGAGGSGLSIYPVALVDQGGSDPTTTPCLSPTAGLTGLQLVSVAWVSNTKVAVLESLRSTPMLFDVATGGARMLGTEVDRTSVAHTLFHVAPKGGAPLACASCHPEGGEDGHVWMIDGAARRTQTLAGGVMARSPFHWKGDLNSLGSLMADTFVRRMGGTQVDSASIEALGRWLDKVPAPRASVVLSAEQRVAGLAAFNKAECGGCHLADGKQEGRLADIGTGEEVRSPNLVGLQARAPFLHTGEIPDIRARVTGTLHPTHGNLAALDAAEKEALIDYLGSL